MLPPHQSYTCMMQVADMDVYCFR